MVAVTYHIMVSMASMVYTQYTRRLLYRLSFYERLIGISFGPLSDERISVGVRVCERDRKRETVDYFKANLEMQMNVWYGPVICVYASICNIVIAYYPSL